MTILYAQFADAGKTGIVSVFRSQPDVDAYTNLGELDANSAIYAQWFAELPPFLRDSWPNPETSS
jgi:hypothetical protein